MPASAGRVRMPHNNRMSTSGALKTSDIWAKTIGHDPHAEQDGIAPPSEQQQAASTAKAAEVMAVARQQNLTDSATRDDFARKLYMGLKGGKKHRTAEYAEAPKVKSVEEAYSSSEDEFEVVQRRNADRSKRKKTKKRSKKKRRRHESSSDSRSSDSEDSSKEERRKKRRSRRKKKRSKKSEKQRKRSDSSDDESSRRAKSGRRKTHEREKDELKSALPPFIASQSYNGTRKGYVFKTGSSGSGYYVDTGSKGV